MSVAKQKNIIHSTFLLVVLYLILLPFEHPMYANSKEENTFSDQDYSTDFPVASENNQEKTAFDNPHELKATIPFVEEQRLKDQSTIIITSWILFSLLVVAVARYLFPVRFKETLLAAWDSRFFNYLERETGLLNHWVSLFLYINYLLSFSLLLYQSIVFYKISHLLHHIGTLTLLAASLALLSIFLAFKYLLMYFTAWIFKTGNPTELYLRNIFLVNKFTGIVLLPFLIVNHNYGSGYILTAAWGVLIIMELFRVFKVARIGLSMKGFSVYHLILYLCAVEIAPILFLIKYSKTLIY